MNSKKLEFLRRGGRVKRFHSFHLLMPNPVGHHTFNLIGILMTCVPYAALSKSLLFAAYEHDLAECITGDLPAPFKRKVPGLREAVDAEEAHLLSEHECAVPVLTATEQRWLKLADSLDGAMHCLEERRLGNRTLDGVFWTFMEYVDELLGGWAASNECDMADFAFAAVYDYIELEWENADGKARS